MCLGLRISEIRALQWPDFDLNGRQDYLKSATEETKIVACPHECNENPHRTRIVEQK
jgi:integrase